MASRNVCSGVSTIRAAIILDNTEPITTGDRKANDFSPVAGPQQNELVQSALLASYFDTTREARSDQAHRPPRHRQADVDHPPCSDGFLHRQRRSEKLRRHSRDVHRCPSGSGDIERDEIGNAAERGSIGAHLQRTDHSGAHPVDAARRAFPRRDRGKLCSPAIGIKMIDPLIVAPV